MEGGGGGSSDPPLDPATGQRGQLMSFWNFYRVCAKASSKCPCWRIKRD